MPTSTTPETDLVDLTPTRFERDPETGLVKGLSYPRRTSDNRIEWHKLIDPRHVVFNSSPKMEGAIVKAYGKPAKELVYGDLIAAGVEVDPRHVLVLLMGFLELADLRGYYSAAPRIAHVTHDWAKDDYGKVVTGPGAICVCECTITWIENEEERSGKASYGTADATMENTGGWGYLAAMAGNRAFVRAVRQGLRIPMMSFDELAKKDSAIPEASAEPAKQMSLSSSTLLKAANSAKLTFEQIRAAAADHWSKLQTDPAYETKLETDPAGWGDWESVPPRDALTLVKTLRARKKVASKAA